MPNDEQSDEQTSFKETISETAEEMSSDDDNTSGEEPEPDTDETDSVESDDAETDQPETEGDDQPSEGETDDGDEPDGSSGDKGPIPYDRFDEVRQQRDDAQETVEDLRKTINAYQNNPDKAAQLVQTYVDKGLLDKSVVADIVGIDAGNSDIDSDTNPESVEETRERLEEVFPPKTAEVMTDLFEQQVQQQNNGQNQQQQTGGPMDENTQQLLQNVNNEVQKMSESDEYPHFETVGSEIVDEDMMGNELTMMDKVALENEDMFILDQTVPDGQGGEVPIYDPDKLDLLYKLAVAESDVVQKEKQKAREEGKQEAKEEVNEKLQENKQASPEEPAGGSQPSGPGETASDADSYKETVRRTMEEMAG